MMGNRSSVLTRWSIVVGLLGVIALVLEWASFAGFIPFPPGFGFQNAIVLVLLAIWLKVGALYHKQP